MEKIYRAYLRSTKHKPNIQFRFQPQDYEKSLKKKKLTKEKLPNKLIEVEFDKTSPGYQRSDTPHSLLIFRAQW